MINLANLILYNDRLWEVKYNFTCDASDHPVTLQPGTYLLMCTGATGGGSSVTIPQNGGAAYGILDLDEATTIHAVVGREGRQSSNLSNDTTLITTAMCDEISHEEIFIGNESKWVNYTYTSDASNTFTSYSKTVSMNINSGYSISSKSNFVKIDAYHVNGKRLHGAVNLLTSSNGNRYGVSAETSSADRVLYLTFNPDYIVPRVQYYPDTSSDTDPDPSERLDISPSDIASIVITWYNIKPEYEYMLPGFNGGAQGGRKIIGEAYYNGAGGGGASDVRLLPYGQTETVTTRYSVPDEFDVMEYAYFNQSSKQWIDTQYVHKSTTRIECDMYTSNVLNTPDTSAIPITTSDTTEYGQCFASAVSTYYSTFAMWRPFDGTNGDSTSGWTDGTTALNGQPGTVYVGYESNEPLKFQYVTIIHDDWNSTSWTGVFEYKAVGSNTWTQLGSTLSFANSTTVTIASQEVIECSAIRLSILSGSRSKMQDRVYMLVIKEISLTHTPTRTSSPIQWEVPYGARKGSPSYNDFQFCTRFLSSWVPNFGRTGSETNGSNYPYRTRAHTVAEGLTVKIYNSDGTSLITSVTTSGVNDDGVCNMVIGTLNNSASTKTDTIETLTWWWGFIYNYIIYEEDELKHYFLPVKRKTGTYEITLTADDFEQGTIAGSGDMSSTSRVRTKDFFRADDFKGTLSFTAYDTNNNPLDLCVAEYYLQDKSVSNVITDGSWIGVGNTYTYTSQYTAYIRFIIRYPNQADISPSDVGTVHIVVTNCDGGMYDLITQTFHANRSILSGSKLDIGGETIQRYIDTSVTYPSSLASRILVAGGGGGATNINSYDYSHVTGFGGGPYGGIVATSSSDMNYKKYASQNDGYKFGIGMTPLTKLYTNGTDRSHGAGGGGGGWYGGFASADQTNYYTSCNGGGGSGYAFTDSSYIPYPDYAPDSKYQLTHTLLDAASSDGPYVKICTPVSRANDGDIITVPKTGSIQTYRFPPGQYRLKCYGGEGGSAWGYATKRGGFSQGVFTPFEPVDLKFVVGGSSFYGQSPAEIRSMVTPLLGYNGGGSAPSYSNDAYSGAANGGGATDIRLNSDSLYARIIVAGGGGGTGYPLGGAGGGLSGEAAVGSNYNPGTQYTPGPGTQTGSPQSTNYPAINGGFGYGGNGATSSSGITGAGGGGWYGGAGSYPYSTSRTSEYNKGGSGGSGYVLDMDSFKPVGYLITDPGMYLTDTQTVQGGNTIRPGVTRIEVEVIESGAFVEMLCRDSQGYKYYDTSNNTWTLLPTQTVTKETFTEYGTYAITDDTGLDKTYDVYCYDDDSNVNTVSMNVVPIKQSIVYHTQSKFGTTDVIVDADYNESTDTVNGYTEGDPSRNISNIIIDVDKKTNSDVAVYSANVTYTESNPKHGRYVSPIKNGPGPSPQYLLPVGSPLPFEIDYKVDYLAPIGGTIPITNIDAVSTTMKDRALFAALILNQAYLRIISINTRTGYTTTIGEYSISSFNNSRACVGILVDDNNIYITNLSSYYQQDQASKLFIVSRSNPYSITTMTAPEYSIGCQGKMRWVSDHEIICMSRYGYVIFNTRKRIFTNNNTLSTTNSSCYDFDINDKFFVLYNGTYLKYYDRDAETWGSYSLTDIYNYHPGIVHGKGRFYVFTDRSKLFVFDDTTMERITTLTLPQVDVGGLFYTDEQLYILINNSPIGLVYDITRNTYNWFTLPWNIPSSSTETNTCAYAHNHVLYVPRFSFGSIMYNSFIKYNFGARYDASMYYIDLTSASSMEFDDRFVSLQSACMKIHDGNVEKPLVGSPLKHATINKSEYNKLNTIKLSKKEEDTT